MTFTQTICHNYLLDLLQHQLVDGIVDDTSSTKQIQHFTTRCIVTYTVQQQILQSIYSVWGAGGGIGTNICSSSLEQRWWRWWRFWFFCTLAVTGGQTLFVGVLVEVVIMVII